MLVLCYLWALALIPFLVEKDDPEVQWHARHGLVLVVAEIALWVALAVISNIPVLGWAIGCPLAPLLWLAIVIIHLIAIIKALQGKRLEIPFVTDFANQWR